MITLGTRIRAARRQCGLSQRSLAARASLSPVTIENLEQDRTRFPRESTLIKLSRVLGDMGDVTEVEVDGIEYIVPRPVADELQRLRGGAS